MKNVILFFFFAIASISLPAQTIIQGQVTDDDGHSLAYANIYIKGSFEGMTADTSGHFRFTTSLTESHILVADFLGYETWEQAIDLTKPSITVQIQLKEKFSELKAVVVTAGSLEAGDTKKSAVLKPLDVVTTAGAQGDITNALQTLPGSTTVGESGRLFVRGGRAEESKTFIDGALVPVPYTSGAPNIAVRGRYNPMMFKGTNFNTGGYSAEYGQALSSVLLLETQGFDAKDRLDISLMTIGAGLSGTKVWDKTAVTATADYTNMGPYFSIVNQRFEQTQPWTSLNGAVSLRQKTGAAGMVKFYATTNQSNTGLRIFDFNAADRQIDYNLTNSSTYANASWKTPVGKKWVTYTGVSYTIDDNEIKYGEADISTNYQAVHAKANATWFATPKISLKFGAEHVHYQSESNTYNNKLIDNNLSGFVESTVFFSKRFVVKPGLRYEHDDYLQEHQLSPRIASALQLGKKGQLSAAYGLFVQNPNDEFLLLRPNLSFEKSEHFILNYEYKPNKNIFRAEVYYKKYKDLMQYDNQYQPESYSQSGNGMASGIDLFYKDMNMIKNASFWVTYSYLFSERNYRDYPETATPGFAAKHKASLVFKYWVNDWRSYISTTGIYSSPRLFDNPNTPDFQAERMKAYKTFNLSWSYLPKPQVVIYASITNVFGFKNSFGYEYASQPNMEGVYDSHEILPSADRFFFLGCFITLSKDKKLNQVDQLQ